ncbi:hypothetical protein J6590_032382 [Homalodisca vitripennis]|nr:hypothetical protein J6590_032382 [Homalodisca vitripennis]
MANPSNNSVWDERCRQQRPGWWKRAMHQARLSPTLLSLVPLPITTTAQSVLLYLVLLNVRQVCAPLIIPDLVVLERNFLVALGL